MLTISGGQFSAPSVPEATQPKPTQPEPRRPGIQEEGGDDAQMETRGPTRWRKREHDFARR